MRARRVAEESTVCRHFRLTYVHEPSRVHSHRRVLQRGALHARSVRFERPAIVSPMNALRNAFLRRAQTPADLRPALCIVPRIPAEDRFSLGLQSTIGKNSVMDSPANHGRRRGRLQRRRIFAAF
jgi:hypothetical protein